MAMLPQPGGESPPGIPPSLLKRDPTLPAWNYTIALKLLLRQPLSRLSVFGGDARADLYPSCSFVPPKVNGENGMVGEEAGVSECICIAFDGAGRLRYDVNAG